MNQSSFKFFLRLNLYPSSFPYSIQAFKALNKLSRNKAILEFSGSNGYVSLSVNFECRDILLLPDFYLVQLPTGTVMFGQTIVEQTCIERNYEEWEFDSLYSGVYCISTFQGKKCSMM